MDRALCSYIDDPDKFFPGPGQSKQTIRAKKVCFECPVKQACKDYRDKTGSEGIWGGESNSRKKRT